MGSLWDEEFPVCCCQVTSSKPLPTQPLAKHTHIRLRRASKIFAQIFCLQSVGEGTLKQRGWIRRTEEREGKKKDQFSLSEIQSKWHRAAVPTSVQHEWPPHLDVKNTPSNNQVKERLQLLQREQPPTETQQTQPLPGISTFA